MMTNASFVVFVIIFLPVIFILSLLLYFYFVEHKLVIERVSVDVRKETGKQKQQQQQEPNEKKKNSLVIAHLSDFHYDYGVENRMDIVLNDILQAIHKIQPDLILLTGDYVNHNPQPIERFCHVFIKRLCRDDIKAVGGNKTRVFASMGNHDSYGSKCDIPSPFENSLDCITHSLSEAGVTVLRNQMVEVVCGEGSSSNNIFICGLEDVWNTSGWRGHHEIMKQLACAAANSNNKNNNNNSLRIVMSHNPDTFHQLCHNSQYQFDLQFSGHAHGGQICIPKSIFNMIPSGRRRQHGFNNERYNIPVLRLLRPIFEWMLSVRIIRRTMIGNIIANWKRHHKYSYVINNWTYSQGLHSSSGVGINNAVDDQTAAAAATTATKSKQLYVTRGVGTHRNMRLFCPPELTILTIDW